MRARKSGRPSPFCKRQAAPSIEPALDGEKLALARRAPDSSLSRESAKVFRLVWIRRKVLPAPLSPPAPPDPRTQTPLRFVPWPWLLREARQFQILLFLPTLPARRASSARPILPARRETFRSARAFPGWRANPRARFLVTEDFPSEIFRPFR